MKYIKHVVIADDEPLQCEILTSILHEIAPEAVIYAAEDGAKAYEYLQNYPVNLLITDIQMPGMDGLELIRHVSEERSEVKIVLISAYQEFEYARKALEYRALDYLLKPFRKEKFVSLMEKVDQMLEAEQKNSEQISYYEAIVQLYRKDCRMEKLAQLLRGKCSVQSIDPDVYQTISGKGVVLLLRWKRMAESGMEGRKEGLTLLQQEKLLQSMHQSFPQGYLVPLDRGVDIQECRMAMILPGSTEEEAKYRMEQCQKNLQHREIIFWCGISQTCEFLADQIRKAIEQAEEMITFSFFTNKTGDTFSWDEYRMNLDQIPKSISNLEKKLHEELHKGNVKLALGKLNELEQEYRKPPYIAAFRIKHLISSMTMRLVRDLEGVLSRKEYDDLVNKGYQLYSICDSIESLFGISRELLQSVGAYFAQESGQMDRVEDIIAYIKKHYRESLSLQELAEKVHFSSGYLSAQIKNHTGETYSEYLMSLRMEEAERLLLNTDQKIVDIVSACGFNDSSYFNRAFRRKYNMSPEKYRKVHKYVEETV